MERHPEFTNIEALRLIIIIQEKNEDAAPAFIEFCRRFDQPLIKLVERSARGFGLSKEEAVQILNSTFERFWKYPNFDLNKMNASSVEKGVVLYLVTIARRLILDQLKLQKGEFLTPYDGSEQIIYDFPKEMNPSQLESEKFRIISKVLSGFSRKHKVIYLTYEAYAEEGFNLPRKLLQELREELDISQNTIRSYRNEILNKIKEYTELWNTEE